jgi:ABC-type branched-subunit amino acid transport system substrate-binding protein
MVRGPIKGLFVAAAVIAMGSLASRAADPGTYRLGFISADTGPLAFAGVSYDRGAALAAEEINAASQPGAGIRIEVVVKEGTEDPAKTIQVMNQFIADHSVLAITCCILTPTAGVLKPLAIARQMPLIFYGATSAGLPAPPYVYNVSSLPTPQEEDLARVVATKVKPKSLVFFVTGDNDAFVNRMAATRPIFEAGGASVAGVISVLSKDTDFTAAATQAIALHPDLMVVYTTGGPAIGIIAALRARGYAGLIVSNGAISPQPMWARAGQALVGVPFPLNFAAQISDTESAKAFIAGYAKKFGADPDVYAACGYSAVYFFAQGLAGISGAPTREALAASLARIGRLDHDVYGGLQFVDGQAQTQKTLFAAWSNDGKVVAWQPR